MGNQKTIDKLNSLIEINNDRIEGYETASRETKENDLKQMFSGFIQTSEKCRRELAEEVSRLGGEPTDSTRTSGKFFRAWMDVKAALTNNDRKTILDSCEYGEDHAVKAYKDVLDDNAEGLSAPQQSKVMSQFDLIKSEHNKVKSMRDALPD